MKKKVIVTVEIKRNGMRTYYCRTSEVDAVPRIVGVACDLVGILHAETVLFVERGVNAWTMAYQDWVLSLKREIY